MCKTKISKTCCICKICNKYANKYAEYVNKYADKYAEDAKYAKSFSNMQNM